MYQFRRLLVALKLDEQDAATLRYAAMISRLIRPDRVYFAHVAESLDIPPSIRAEFPQVAQTPEDAVHANMDHAVRSHFDAAGDQEVLFDTTEGSAVFELLRLIRRHDIDLAITGRAKQKAESGGIPDKLACKAPCSVLIVPDGSEARLERILVPVDFQNQFHYAFEEAIDIARKGGSPEIICLHVYRVPIGYHRSGKSYEQFADIMKEHASRAYEKFVAGFDTKGVNLRPSFELADSSTTEAIDRAARHFKPHLIMMGARGRREGAGLLLGSATERMIWRASVPLMAVKKKGVGMDVVDALLNL